MDGQERELLKPSAKNSAPLDVTGTLDTLKQLKQQIRVIEKNLAEVRREQRNAERRAQGNRGVKDQSALVDLLIATLGVKNDSALARALDVLPGGVSKVRNGKPVGAGMLLRMHEVSGLSIGVMKEYLNPAHRLK